MHTQAWQDQPPWICMSTQDAKTRNDITGGPAANMIVYRLREGFFFAVWHHRNDDSTPEFSCKQVEAAVGGKGDSFTEIKVGLTYFKNKEDRVQLLPLRFIP